MAKKDTKPGYFNNKPLLKVISEMKKTVGLQDSCIQTNEVAIRFFEEKAIESGNIEDFIKLFCKNYSISLGIRDFNYLKTIQYKSYILQTYNLIEPFFKSLNRDYRYYNNFTGIWRIKNGEKNLDPFNQLIENIPDYIKSMIVSYPEYHLLDYYRLIRNSIVHLQESPEEHKKTTKYFNENIEPNIIFFYENYGLKAPNKPDDISFQDFMLYTRAIKYFSNILNDACFPSTKSLVTIASMDEALQKKLQQSRHLNYEGALLKRINILRGFFHSHFNISHKELRDDFCRAYLDTESIDYSEYL